MPTATVTGALLGLAYELHANFLRKNPAGGVSLAFSMVIGAYTANKIVEWDIEAQRRKLKGIILQDPKYIDQVLVGHIQIGNNEAQQSKLQNVLNSPNDVVR